MGQVSPSGPRRILSFLKWALFLGVLAGPAMVWLSGAADDGPGRIGLAAIAFYTIVATFILGPLIRRRWW